MTQVVPGGWKERFMERGRAEGELTGAMKKALEVARNLLGIGTSADAVARTTDLPLADVERLAAEIR